MIKFEIMPVYIITLLIFLLFYTHNEVMASMKPNDIRKHLGSRTPYRFRSNTNDTLIKYSDCKDAKIWMVIRHGTRFPGPKDILRARTTLAELKFEILMHHKHGKGQLNKRQLERFIEWTSDIDVEQDRFLTLEGQEEMILLAERMHNRFPHAVKDKYSNSSFLFRYTATQRAQQSAKYFVNGLFEKKDAQNVTFAPVVKVDPVLRFYKHCDKWQQQVKKNPDTYKEQRLYSISREMNETLESVSKRLGFSGVLSLDDLNIMYKMCGYETAWSKYHKSPWCYAFNENSIQVMEYYHDLKHYWVDGYGYDLTYRQACVSIKNMFDNFRSEDGPQSTFLFAHSGTVLKILTHLHLYKPESPLTGEAIVKDRPWRTSDIDCFGANLAFVLFKCKDGDHVLTLHQEHVIKLPMCQRELCPLEHLLEYFRESIYNCNYTDMCSL